MCCDICIHSADYSNDNKNIICGRTMEFAEPLKSKFIFMPRNKIVRDWTNPYGFVGVKILDTDIIVDGMNEKGLSCGLLVMDDTKYHSGSGISITDICSYILGTCVNVNDAINVLSNINIIGVPIPVIDRLLGLHIVIHDAHGVSIVCEINDENKIYYTEGVVTNGPDYPTQLGIRDGYLICDKYSLSIDRFIKLSELKRVCIPESYDVKGIIQLICRIFNTVDIIRGVSESIRDYGIIYSTTQWVLIKDLTSKIIYYRSQNNMTLRRINLNNIDFTRDYTEISIDDIEPTIIDLI